MFTNYSKIALRIVRKDSTFTLINVVGLSTGLAVAYPVKSCGTGLDTLTGDILSLLYAH